MVVDAVAPWGELVLFTADDLAALPDDGWHYELVEGRLVRMAPTGGAHGEVTGDLVVLLRPFVLQRRLGTVSPPETGFLLSFPGEPETVLAPDLAFIASATMPREEVRAQAGYLRVAPDLVVEVASPSQHRPEMTAKAKRWLEAGVKVVWVVWPERDEVDVWETRDPESPRTLRQDDELDGGDLLPGFAVPVSQLWS
jgi:Uma2 family endonuclease